jgi:signal peptidase II
MAKRGYQSNQSKPFLLWIGLSIVVIILDQISKLVVLDTIPHRSSIRVNDFLNWVLVFNPGAAFSFLADGAGWQKWFFIAIGLIATIVMIWLLFRHAKQSIFCFSISMILGGAVGNLIDRFTHGAVVDFIDVYYRQYHWPAFNLADSAITLGTFLLILDELRRVIKQR